MDVMKAIVSALLVAAIVVPTGNALDFNLPIEITHSDDGRSIELPYFLLQVYATDGTLAPESLETLQDALDTFLLAEMNAVFSPQHAIDFVNSTMKADIPVELPKSQRALLPLSRQHKPTVRERMDWEMQHGSMDTRDEEVRFLKGRRNQETIIGSQVDVFINVTFDRVPMPTVDRVDAELKNVMSNLGNFVKNLTALQDPEFVEVYLAIRLEPPTPSPSSTPSSVPSETPTSQPTLRPSQTPVPTVHPTDKPTPVGGATGTGVIDNLPPSSVTQGDGSNNTIIISSVLVAALVVVVGVFLVWKRRAREEEPDKEGLFEIESDLESSMGGLSTPVRSPSTVGGMEHDRFSIPSPTPDEQSYPVDEAPAGDYTTGDSVFSGLTDILNDTGSPRLRPVKSMSSATTIKADNMGKFTPMSLSGTNSLFTFEEIEEEQENKTPALRSSDVSDSDSDTNRRDRSTTSKVKAQQRSLKSPPAEASPAPSAGETKKPDRGETPQRRNNSVEQAHDSVAAAPPNGQPITGTSSNQSWQARMSQVGSTVMSAVGVGGALWKPQSQKSSVTEESESENTKPSFRGKVRNFADGSFPSLELDHAVGRRRHHVGYNGKEDGTSAYQTAMHPLDWSNTSERTEDDSTTSSAGALKQNRRFVFDPQVKLGEQQDQKPFSPLFSPHSQAMSTVSGQSAGSRSTNSSQMSASRQLINDLVWLEKKIADVKSDANDQNHSANLDGDHGIEPSDSLSYVSNDAMVSPSSKGDGSIDESQEHIMQSIVCRDCFAPPGKLQIVIHSTKDGPAVHTVKSGSSLEGHIFPGDLIIGVDNVDTRAYTAEQVMKMMAAKSGFERKITVLHFED